MENGFNHSAKSILDKVFPSSEKGYDPYEVDCFLDEIISDYLLLEQNGYITEAKYASLVSEINELRKENQSLKIDLDSYKRRFDGISSTKNVSKENIDYITRISKLEKALFDAGIDPSSIK
ncbi:MAG: DivIVA domain-containing protein [Coprobacillus sp.]|nr:DivIVA domain-containing protein [Coprobacillus sp.]